MAHDGFPVKRLMGMTQEEAETRANETDQEIIRAVFDDKLRQQKPRFYGGGCPFIAGPMYPSRIVNRGSQSIYEDDVEVLEFVSTDGAVIHSYDTRHLFTI